jgi:RNA polymerase sigma-70 factor (ECF subfamily)
MADVNAYIQRWQQGDERAAELLYNHHRDATFRLAYGLLGNREDAEEVAQDALTYALVNINRYDANLSRFSTWLHTITVSRCRDKRRRKILPQFSLTLWLQRGQDIPDYEPGPEGAATSSETQSQVWQAVQQLKPPLREAIILRYWSGQTYREMAEILGCPLPTAQSRVRLAYDHLRSLLSANELAYLEQELPHEPASQ